MIHQVARLPEEGEYVRTKCGRMTNDRDAVARHKHEAPEGAEFCRGACWRQGLSDKSKVILIEDLTKSHRGELISVDQIKAILEDRYYPENNRSPKAA